ncbi:MAG: glycoside hydrolase family 127 protein [Kiritimatiellaeota bacterium]|nr:glycoside hydrolase family 127 protein [Kiritimatiellota bacterium]
MTKNEAVRPHAALNLLPMDAARWTEGFWAQRFELCHRTVIPKMKEALEHPRNSAWLGNFRIAAGLEEGQHRGTNWSDGDCYKWIEAMAHVYAVTKDPALDREMDFWIDLIAQSQEDDGYICTQVQLDPEKKRWGLRIYHELYNMGHLMTAAAVHCRATGKETFVAVARKLADYLCDVFGPRPEKLAHFGWNPSNIMGLVDLYHVTNEPRYLELAGIFVDMRGSAPTPRNAENTIWAHDPPTGDQNQDRTPLRRETEAVGHAVTAAYLWCGAADIVAETGERELMAALERIWANMVGKKMYITGAIGVYHLGVSSRSDKVHEAFGHQYELPNRTAYNETCANIANAMWNRRMLSLTGDAKYAEVMERVLYNSALSGMSVDGTRFCYTNPLARNAGGPLLSNDSAERWFLFSCYCCPPQVARTLASVHEWICNTSAETLWLHLYGSSTVNAHVPEVGPVTLVQRTDYPWDGHVAVTVEEAPGSRFTIMLRIPAWAEGAAVAVNGEDAGLAVEPGAYLPLERRWRGGDVIELSLPMRVRYTLGHPLVEETQNMVAVMRGPIVYCLESVDLPEGIPLHEVRLLTACDLTPRYDADLLGGVVVLEGHARRCPQPEWTDRLLYAELTQAPAADVPVRLVPYFSWLNRGQHSMRVWLPFSDCGGRDSRTSQGAPRDS